MLKKLRLIQNFLFWWFIFFLPSQLGRHFWFSWSRVYGLKIDYLAPTVYLTDLIVFLIFGLFLLENWGKFISLLKHRRLIGKLRNLWIVIFLFFSFVFLNCFKALNPWLALYGWLKLAEMIFVGYWISYQEKKRFFWPLCLAVFYTCLLAIFQFLKKGSLGGVFWWLGERLFSLSTPGIARGNLWGRVFLRPYASFSHPNSLAGFLWVTLILMWNEVFSKRKRSFVFSRKNIFLVSDLILGSVVIGLCFSRPIWILLLLALILLFGMSKKFYFLILAVFGVFLLFRLGFWQINGASLVNRSELNREAVELFWKSPLWGLGWRNFIIWLPRLKLNSMDYLSLQPVHNIFLMILCETGMVGFLMFSYLVIKRLISFFQTKDYILLFLLFSILFTGLFDHYWLTLQQNQLLLGLVFGLSFSKRSSVVIK